jgi:acetyltransferase-like isoleucine patch superfamily enzyme
MKIRIHPTAIVEPNVRIGEGTSVWDGVHIRSGAIIGEECIIGEKTYIAGEVRIGDRCKLNAYVYIPSGVTIETGVMIAAHTVFTNDQYPRACTPDLSRLRPSEVDEHTRATVVREGATIGANCTIGNDLVVGRFAMVGMASVVTRSVRDFHLVLGSPARPVGAVCRCGQPLFRFDQEEFASPEVVACSHCGWAYRVHGTSVEDLASDAALAA